MEMFVEFFDKIDPFLVLFATLQKYIKKTYMCGNKYYY